MVVVVAECWGLHVAHTQFRELNALTPELERAAAALRGMIGDMRAATIVGRTLGDVLDAAQRGYRTRGLEREWTLHHQGGTIGYQPRERIADPGDRTAIRPGMAFAWNPSLTGLKVEETLYLDTEGQQHVLTTTP
jgi:Xaa-Pro dipeptidase